MCNIIWNGVTEDSVGEYHPSLCYKLATRTPKLYFLLFNTPLLVFVFTLYLNKSSLKSTGCVQCLALKYIRAPFCFHSSTRGQTKKSHSLKGLCHEASLIISFFCAIWPSKHSLMWKASHYHLTHSSLMKRKGHMCLCNGLSIFDLLSVLI